ncbi:outer membrane beta-barrel protein [Paracidobacterium acidisoli]|uniref:outer membrane beta-barrel protein n=1 Tax=Paracidobacterium acidisoli TaxID=2303751 RepID=UPI001314C4D1|nr:porin family protein [Paracidobacterium acidisoli]
MLKKIVIAATLFFLPAAIYAQSAPAVTGGGSSIWAGGEFSNFANDYLGRDVGPTVFVDYNVHPKWGAEGEARWLNWSSKNASTEKLSNYLIGPRYRIVRFHHLSVWGKFLLGAGLQTYPSVSQAVAEPIGSGSYFAYAPGVDGEYRITSRISARAGYEWQFWPSAPGAAFTNGRPSNGLTPTGWGIGFNYRILGR